MENNIPTLYILELDSLAAKNATILNIQCPFVQKKVKNPIFIVYSCCHGSRDARLTQP